jgi:hypothetical protein
MKTAVQQVFSDLEELHPNLFNVYTTEGKEFINHFHKYLAIEKEQIEEAYNVGYYMNKDNSIMNCEEYYEETFKPESNEPI